MALPGFGAESALGPARFQYRSSAVYGAGAQDLSLQQDFDDMMLGTGEDDQDLSDDGAELLDADDGTDEVSLDADEIDDSAVGDVDEERDDDGSVVAET